MDSYLAALYVVESCSLSCRFGYKIGHNTVGLRSFLFGNGIPVRLRIGIPRPKALVRIEHVGKRSGDNDSLHRRVVFLQGTKNASRTVDRWLEQFIFEIGGAKYKRGRDMNYLRSLVRCTIDIRVSQTYPINSLDGFIKSARSCNIRDNSKR